MWNRFELGSGRSSGEPSGEPLPEGRPLRLLLVGDFSGRKSRGAHDPARTGSVKPVAVDRDNWETVLGKIQPSLLVGLGKKEAGRFSLTFKELDDFHPDRIFAQLDFFSKLRDTRRRLLDHRTFAEAAAEVRSWAAAPALAPPAPPSLPPPRAADGDDENLLEAMLAESAQQPQAPKAGDSMIRRLIREVVGPHVIPGAAADQDKLVKAVDEAVGEEMRALLSHPDFRALESAWRSVRFLIRRMSDDAQVQVFLLDVTREELADELSKTEDLTRTGIYKNLVTRTVGTPGGEPWGAVLGLFAFEPIPAHLEVLHRLGIVAAAGRTSFVAAASDTFLGIDSIAAVPDADDWQPIADPDARALWDLLRTRPEAGHLCLTLPRFLLRTPYGRETETVESFEFEEVPPGREPHDFLLWGNGAVLVGHLLGEGYVSGGLRALPRAATAVDGLPAYLYDDSGDREMYPCGEALLTDAALELLVPRGLTPVISFRRQDRVMVAPIQGIDGQVLRGCWS